MDQELYKKIKRRVEHLSTKFGYSLQEAEDITHEIVVLWINKKPGQYLEHAIVDVLRKQSGRKQSNSYDARMNIKNAVGDLVNEVFDQHLEGKQRKVRGIVSFLNKDDRALILLKIHWGLNNVELADLYGVTQSRISQMVTKVLNRIIREENK